VRAAAGEALALIYHTTSLAEDNSSEEEEEEEEAESMSVVSSGSLAGLEDVVDRMKELATNKGEKLRRSKRDKAATKSVFRELHGMLQVRGGQVGWAMQIKCWLYYRQASRPCSMGDVTTLQGADRNFVEERWTGT
jgi:hypothetical protein